MCFQYLVGDIRICKERFDSILLNVPESIYWKTAVASVITFVQQNKMLKSLFCVTEQRQIR